MPDEPTPSRKPAPEPGEPVITVRRTSGEPLSLTLNEYRLALLALVDFEGDWAALQAAAAFVVDGSAKAALIRERLLDVGGHLAPLLGRGVDGLELLAARHWFRNSQL